MKRIVIFTLFFLALISSKQNVVAQELNIHLQIFKPLIGKSWTGHFQNPLDTEITHICKWEIIKNGNAVRLNKHVPEVAGFTMETTYYWDRVDQVIKSFTITSNGYINEGTVRLEDGVIVNVGFQSGPEHSAEFKLTLEFDEENVLHDHFSSKVNGEWKPGHYIRYSNTLIE